MLRITTGQEAGRGKMMRLLKFTLTIILIFTSSWLFLACTQTETPQQPVEIQEEKPSTDRSSVVSLDAVVDSVDYDARTFSLTDEDGNTQSFTVRNPSVPLEALKAGDNVSVTIYERQLAFVAEPGAELPSDEALSAVGTAKGSVTVTKVEQTTFTVNEIDLENRTITVESDQMPEFTLPVRDDVQNLENLKVGDKVLSYVTQVVAVSIKE